MKKFTFRPVAFVLASTDHGSMLINRHDYRLAGNGGYGVGFQLLNIERIAIRKLQQIHAATALDFLRVPPGNRLEKLLGDREGYWSIRINDQWRICFQFAEGHALDVEIVDYH